jgi:hypothetical protein
LYPKNAINPSLTGITQLTVGLSSDSCPVDRRSDNRATAKEFEKTSLMGTTNDVRMKLAIMIDKRILGFSGIYAGAEKSWSNRTSRRGGASRNLNLGKKCLMSDRYMRPH